MTAQQARIAPDAAMPAVPPPAPLAMPTQVLANAPTARFPAPAWRTVIARVIAFGGGAAVTALGAHQMSLVFDPLSITLLQAVLLVLFTLTFGWISFAAAAAVAGILVPPLARPRNTGPLTTRTALAMPVYNEDPSVTFGALGAMGLGLARIGAADAFEIFVLSDTRDPVRWLAETAAFGEMRARLGGAIPAWYRRRRQNTGKKAGNIHEFVERWGGRYDHILVLDADSVMDPGTLVEMVRRMEAEPRLGILQTVPLLAGGRTLLARLQQFAGRVYGGAVARGVSAWQGQDGNFWGHNALIRTRAFAAACGLPTLPGRPPFGGAILSHDFVEAALIRRAGWIVRMDTDLTGSWEGAPPSLIDIAARDRRWVQGNLQHIRVLPAAGLRWPNRVHFLIGIGSYLASPLWLGMIVVGFLLTFQAELIRPEYFSRTYQLFPHWPRFDAERMRLLYWCAIGVLLVPKVLGLARTLWDRQTRLACGGALALVVSALIETLLSALYAPVLMVLQTRQIWEILTGRDAGWSTQNRQGALMSWRQAFALHGRQAASGIGLALGLAYLAPELLIWVAPVLLGLTLAPILSRISGDARIGRLARRLALFVTPEERVIPPIFAAAARERAGLVRAAATGLDDLMTDPAARARHAAALDRVAGLQDSDFLDALTAQAKIGGATHPGQAAAWLTPAEMVAVLHRPKLVEAMARAGGPQIAAKPPPPPRD